MKEYNENEKEARKKPAESCVLDSTEIERETTTAAGRSGACGARTAPAAAAAARTGEPKKQGSLVTCSKREPKRQRNQVIGLEIYLQAVKLIRDYQGWNPTPPSREALTGLSKKAQASIRFKAINADPQLIS